MEEVWKDITGYEGLYKISNIGRVMALSRRVRFGSQCRNTETKIMKPRKKCNGNTYLSVILYNKYRRPKTLYVHRLVALHFVNGYYDGADVNHKDGNKSNNLYTNLEWCSRSKNILHSIHTLGMTRMQGKVVLQLSMDNVPMCFYKSAVEASSVTGICKSCITDCATGKQSYAGNYKWQYF